MLSARRSFPPAMLTCDQPIGAGLPVFIIGGGIYWLIRAKGAPEKGEAEGIEDLDPALLILNPR
jgi:hypothetical protein